MNCLINNRISNQIKSKLQQHNTHMDASSYQETPYRHTIIAVYLLASLVNQIPTNTFTAMTSKVQNQYGIQPILVTLNFLFFPISHCIFAIPVNWALTKKGIRFSYIVAAITMIIGVWLRITLTTDNPYVCLLGSLLSGGSSLILLSSGSKIALNWFKKQHLTQVTFLCVLSNFLSLSIGLILPGIFIDKDSTKQHIISFLRFQAIIVSIPFILLTIFIRQKPDIPPSKHAEVEHSTKNNRYADVLKLLFKNKNYWKLVLVMSLTFGTVVAYLSIIDKGLVGLGYQQPTKIIMIIVIAFTIAGLLGNLCFSALVKKTKRYKLISIIMTFGFFIGFMILNFGFFQNYDSTIALILISILMGFTYFAIPSYFVVYGSQIAFPADQASVAGYLFAIAQTFGFVLGLILVPLIDETSQNTKTLFLVLAGIILLGAILTPLVEQDLRKQKFEHGLLSQQLKKQLRQQQVQIAVQQLSIESQQQQKQVKALLHEVDGKKARVN